MSSTLDFDNKARLHIESKVFGKIIQEIDDTNILRLSNSDCSRMSLMLFAAAVGKVNGGMTPLKNKKDFVRGEYVKDEAASQIRSIAIDQRNNGQTINDLVEDDAAIDIFEQYANTGFNIIEDWIKELDGSKDEQALETVVFNRLYDLDEIYKETFGD